MYSKIKKNEAIKLRKEGFSYADISSKLKIAKSTLSDWLKEVVFIPNDLVIKRVEENNRKISQIKRVDKMNSVLKADQYAKESIGVLSERDIFILGLGIYIGEGSKTGDCIRIANSDPRIIRFTMKWFKICFGLSDSNFKVRIHMYPDNNEDDVIEFWMKMLNIKKEAFYRSLFDNRLNKKRKNKNILPYGTAHLSIVSDGNKDIGTLLHRKILASIDSVLK
jgi:hypothetical protein